MTAPAPAPGSVPYLSLVATARNDNHGGNLLGRMQHFIDGLADQCERFALDAELILVEWNPPADQPRLTQALKWPAGHRHLAIRIIEVPSVVHARFDHADRLPLFQFIAKNVGIRRAAGRFVLATNIDLLFSDDLMRFIASRRLAPDRMYRVDRLDVDPDVPPEVSVLDRLAYCASHVIRVNGRLGTRDRRTGGFHRIYWEPTLRVRLLEALQDLRLVPAVTRKRLHLNGCGDFTLLSRERWFALRGYTEMQIFSMHLDSLFCTAAHFGGARERVLPPTHVAYHIEHGTGSGWTPEGEAKLNARLAAAGIPQLSHDQFHKWAVNMRRDRQAMMFNEESWGLAGEALPETRVV